LAKQAPDLARALRAKTFFFEDLRALDPTSLRVLVQEVGYPAMGLALKSEARDLRDVVLRNLAAGIRDVVLQEMELSRQDEAAITDAKSQVIAAGQRLLAEGRILLGGSPGAK
jgi:flagellar motor switch protein FliG